MRSSVTLKFAGGYAETYKSWNNNKKPQPIMCVAYNTNELLLLIVGFGYWFYISVAKGRLHASIISQVKNNEFN